MQIQQPSFSPSVPSGDPITYTIEPESVGERLDRYVAARCTDLTRSRIQGLIRDGQILLNSETARPSESLRKGDVISVRVPGAVPAPPSLVAEAIDIDILFEDETMLVLNKRAGMVVHPGAGVASGTLVNALLHHTGTLSVIGGVERPGIVHRLDKETSGCLVVAKCDVAHQSLARQFADRTIKKVYLAITEFAPPRGKGTVTASIGRHPIHRQKMSISDRPWAREAETDYAVLNSGNGLYLIECRPKTGRTHQIRVHLKSLKCPVAGDAVYGRRGPFTRHLLHAWQITFEHPVSGVQQTVTAPIPDDFPLRPPDL
jgi:23S rRNA pseudouridine1911/1915/1917 synthase